MLICQTCESSRVFSFYAKHYDRFCSPFKDRTKEPDYAPFISNIYLGNGEIDVCLECGQVQGFFPVEFDYYDEEEFEDDEQQDYDY